MRKPMWSFFMKVNYLLKINLKTVILLIPIILTAVIVIFYTPGLFSKFYRIFSSALFAAPFTDDGTGTITDQQTQLVWQKCSMGQNNDSNCSGNAKRTSWMGGPLSSGALNYCKTLTLGGKAEGLWRLPDINELKLLLDAAKFGWSLDREKFPLKNNPGIIYGYWSSSSVENNTALAWYIEFNDGAMRTGNKSGSRYVRCVSGP